MIQRLVSLGGVMLALCAAAPASAQIILGGKSVDVNAPAAAATTFPVDPDKADYKPLVVAIPAFSGATDAEKEFAAKVGDTVRNDLASIGLFAAPEASAISAFTADIGARPVWADWSGAGVDLLVLGKVVIDANQQLAVQFRLYDIAASKELLGTQFTAGGTPNWHRVAHKSADAIMQKLVGGEAGFDSRLAYVAESGGKTQLAFIAPDGGASEVIPAPITSLKAPRQSRNSSIVIYSAQAPVPGKATQAQRTAIVYDLTTGRRESLSTGAQPNGDARYPIAQNDGSLIYSRQEGANTDIYRLTLGTRKETRLTDDPATETEPALSPDGSQFAFVSDRGGTPQIYVARVDGTPMTCAGGAQAKACNITPAGGGHGSPVWSPRGDWIAFAHKTGEEIAIHLVRPDGSETRALTDPGVDMLDLSPTWSPEGRRIAFSRMVGDRAKLAVVNLTGGEPQTIATDGNAFDPDWGPVQP